MSLCYCIYLFFCRIFLLSYLKVCKSIVERNWNWQAIRETWRGRLATTESRLRAIRGKGRGGGCVCKISAISKTEIVFTFSSVQSCALMGDLAGCWSFAKRAIVTTSVGRSFVPVPGTLSIVERRKSWRAPRIRRGSEFLITRKIHASVKIKQKWENIDIEVKIGCKSAMEVRITKFPGKPEVIPF